MTNKFFLLLVNILFFTPSFAQETETNITSVYYPDYFGVSVFADEIPDETGKVNFSEIDEAEDREHRKPIHHFHTSVDGKEWGNDPKSIQKTMGERGSSPPTQDWAGQYGGGYPPDPSGAAGINHYVQAVNRTPVKVFNKSTGGTLANFSLGSLWNPAITNAGDPIVIYDKHADRWFIAQFDNFPSQKVYIALSKTPNPAGQYYTWTYTASYFPDYLKFSVWHDGYYMTINGGREVYCFERSAMITGSPTARMIKAAYTSQNGPSDPYASFCPLTGDADGILPTTGPCPMIYPVDNGWGASADGVYLKQITVNWSGSPTMSISTGSLISTSSHDMSSDPQGKDIDQPSGNKLDGIAGVPWFRSQWRQWTGYNTLLCCFGVKINSSQRSIKWVELRQDQNSGIWTKYQEGVYAPDTKSRWVASIAMDDYGNIGMSYARSSLASGDYPSCAYTGRLKNDPLGQMTIAETIVPGGTGTSSQSANVRFGDYSHTTVDPVDGCTFWSTVEYLAGGAPKTRIWSYQIMTCSGVGVEENTNELLSDYSVFQTEETLNILASKLVTDNVVLVDVFDIMGKIIYTKQLYPSSKTISANFDVSSLVRGTYFVRIGNVDFQKVIKVFIK